MSHRRRRLILYEKDRTTRTCDITLNRPDQLNIPTIAAAGATRTSCSRRASTTTVKVLHRPWYRRSPRYWCGPGRADGEAGSGRRAGRGIGIEDDDDVTMPGCARTAPGHHCSTGTATRDRVAAAFRTSKKISILEVKGDCYGWHFYQAADADLVISSDDALFGHPAFRYVGYAPRMWQWAMMMGLRKSSGNGVHGWPFTARADLRLQLREHVVTRDQLEAEVDKYAACCARTRPTDTDIHAEGVLRSDERSTRVSTWEPAQCVARIDGWHAPEDDDGRRVTLTRRRWTPG